MLPFATGLTTRRAGSSSNHAIDRAIPSANMTLGTNSETSRRTFELSKTVLWALSPRRLALLPPVGRAPQDEDVPAPRPLFGQGLLDLERHRRDVEGPSGGPRRRDVRRGRGDFRVGRAVHPVDDLPPPSFVEQPGSSPRSAQVVDPREVDASGGESVERPGRVVRPAQAHDSRGQAGEGRPEREVEGGASRLAHPRPAVGKHDVQPLLFSPDALPPAGRLVGRSVVGSTSRDGPASRRSFVWSSSTSTSCCESGPRASLASTGPCRRSTPQEEGPELRRTPSHAQREGWRVAKPLTGRSRLRRAPIQRPIG
jgi:hypothetical protein